MDKTITTVNEYKVTLKSFLTYDQFIEIQKLWMRDVLIDVDNKDDKGTPKTPSMGKIPATVMYEANKLAVSFLVLKIENKDGVEVKRQGGELPVPLADGAQIMDEVNRISNEASQAFDKKKAKP